MIITLSEIRKNLDAAWSLVAPLDIEMGANAYRGYYDTLRAYASHYGLGIASDTQTDLSGGRSWGAVATPAQCPPYAAKR